MTTMLKVKKRDDLRGSKLRQLRQKGFTPAVIYGKDLPSKPISVETMEFIKTLKITGKNGVIDLATDEGTYRVITHDIQTEPLKGEILHIDFYKFDMKKEMDADVAVNLVGEPIGVKDGGVIQQTLYEVSVRALPNDIPEGIEVDISEMVIGDSLQVRDLPKSSQYEINNEPEEGIMSLLPPTLDNEPDEQQEEADKEEVQAENEDEEE